VGRYWEKKEIEKGPPLDGCELRAEKKENFEFLGSRAAAARRDGLLAFGKEIIGKT